MDTLRNYY